MNKNMQSVCVFFSLKRRGGWIGLLVQNENYTKLTNEFQLEKLNYYEIKQLMKLSLLLFRPIGT